MGIGADYGSVSKTKSNQMDSWLWWKAAQSTALKPPSKVLRLQDQARLITQAGRRPGTQISERCAACLGHGIAPDMAAMGNSGRVLAGSATLKTPTNC
jgi:hypothetical protein